LRFPARLVWRADGQSVFIGGLIKRKSSFDRQGVPVLGDLPLIGNLFANRQETVSTAETVVVITPHVVAEPEDADKFSDKDVSETAKASDAILEAQKNLNHASTSEPTSAAEPATRSTSQQ